MEEPKAHELYDKLVAFSGFGFPKSHAAAFGLLAYQSAWLRHHYAPEFLAALLNAQPMGFYPPATLVRDGQRRGVETRPPDVNLSEAGCTIEEGGAVRVGLKYVTGLGEDDAEAVAAKRPYSSIRELAQQTGLSEDELRALAESGACDGFGLRRRDLLWQLGLVPRPASVPGTAGKAKQLALPLEPTVATPELPEPTRVGADAHRLPHDEPVGRRPSARAAAAAPAARERCRAPSCKSVRTGPRSSSPGSWSRGSGRRPRTESSSCSSRTSLRR